MSLEAISEHIRAQFTSKNAARDLALARSRELIRLCAETIRAVHRREWDAAGEKLLAVRAGADSLRAAVAGHPDLYHAGYTQDAIKEFTEASITCALIQDKGLPTPEDLGVEIATYWNGLAEVVGELRRRCLDILRQGYSTEAERLLGCMDDIYTNLVTMDYPDAVTQGLRRQTDLVRGIVERTRGDLTLSLRFQLMERALIEYTQRVNKAE